MKTTKVTFLTLLLVLALAALLVLSCSDGDDPSQARIAFISERDGNAELYVINADGSGLKRLTETEGGESFPSWSPDGEQLAYVGESAAFYVTSADGSGPKKVLDNPGNVTVARPMAWSPTPQKAFCLK